MWWFVRIYADSVRTPNADRLCDVDPYSVYGAKIDNLNVNVNTNVEYFGEKQNDKLQHKRSINSIDYLPEYENHYVEYA